MATLMATLRDLVFLFIGILTLYFIVLCKCSGTPALSRPNNKISSFLNLNLSRDRANSIKRTLIDSGIDPDRIEIKALGEEEPIFDNKSFSGRGFNRCVLITIF